MSLELKSLEDTDSDDLPDLLSLDDDGDGLSDREEEPIGSDPNRSIRMVMASRR